MIMSLILIKCIKYTQAIQKFNKYWLNYVLRTGYISISKLIISENILSSHTDVYIHTHTHIACTQIYLLWQPLVRWLLLHILNQ